MSMIPAQDCGAKHRRLFCAGRLKRGLSCLMLSLLALPAVCDAGFGRTRFSDAAEMNAVLAEAFSDIEDYYIKPVSLRELTFSGLARLDPVPDALKVEALQDSIVMELDGTEILREPEPKEGDAQGWADLVTHITARARHFPFLASVSTDEIYNRLFAGFMQRLDRFTRYTAPSQADDQRAQRDGFGGIGIVLDYTQGLPRITEVLPNGPAARGGLKIGDLLMDIDGNPVADLSPNKIPGLLRGEVGSRVVLELQREQVPRPITVALNRSLVVPPSVTHTVAENDVAVFRISLFNHDTGASLAEAIDQVQRSLKGRMRGAILDLRDNPGGLLDQGVDVASLFLDGGPVISTTGRHPKSLQNFSATDKDRLHGLPIAVLVNGGSASAAEIVASALQDRGRAIVVGSSSYGKGTVQMVLTLPNGAELTLTWARMMTPGGYTLHEHGVVPGFCTAALVSSEQDDEGVATPPELVAAVLQQPALPISRLARARLKEQEWQQLRQSCPPVSEDSELDIAVADRVLVDGGLYTSALAMPGVAVAGSARRAPPPALRVQ